MDRDKVNALLDTIDGALHDDDISSGTTRVPARPEEPALTQPVDNAVPDSRRPQCTTRCNRVDEYGVCDWCRNRNRNELDELPSLHNAVTRDLARSGGSGEKISGTREAPLPVSVDRLSWVGPVAPGRPGDPDGGVRTDLYRDQTGPIPLAGVLASWVRRIAQETGVPQPLPTVAVMCGWLYARADWSAQQEWAADYAAEIHEQWRIGRGLAGIRPSHERIWRACPRCDMRVMIRRVDEHRYECVEADGGCGTLWTHEEWEALTEHHDKAGAA